MAETKENGTVAESHGESTDGPVEAVEEHEVVNEQELKYWKAVKENPADFTSWTYLLQFVEQEVCAQSTVLFIISLGNRVYEVGICCECHP